MFVLVFPSTHEKCGCDVSPIAQLVHVSTFHSIELHPICYPSSWLTSSSIFFTWVHWPHIFLQYDECNFLFLVSSSLFPVELMNIYLLPLAILFMSLCFVLLSVQHPLSFSSRFFPLLLLSQLLSFYVYLRHSGTSPSKVRCLSRPPPFPFRSSVFLVSSPLLSLFFSCMWESRRQLSWACPCLLLHSCIFRCCGFSVMWLSLDYS